MRREPEGGEVAMPTPEEIRERHTEARRYILDAIAALRRASLEAEAVGNGYARAEIDRAREAGEAALRAGLGA